MTISIVNRQKCGIFPEVRIGFLHHFGMVEGNRADEHGEGCQCHHDAVVVMGAEMNFGVLHLSQLFLHGHHPVGLFEMQVVEAREASLYPKPSTCSGERWIKVRMVEEIKVQRVFFRWNLSQNDVLAFHKSPHTQGRHPFSNDDVALPTR